MDKFGEVTNGYVTVEAQAEFLKRYAHYVGEADGSRYYILNDFGYRVVIVDGKPVQLFKLSTNEAETIVKCSKLKFNK